MSVATESNVLLQILDLTMRNEIEARGGSTVCLSCDSTVRIGGLIFFLDEGESDRTDKVGIYCADCHEADLQRAMRIARDALKLVQERLGRTVAFRYRHRQLGGI